jgi:lycopene beta-cyclase
MEMTMHRDGPDLPKTDFDYVLVGGGLQSALLALTLRERRPSARIAMVERAERLGGNHTWCFHSSDVSGPMRRRLAPLVVAEWPAYEVRFPDGDRVVGDAYAAILPERLHAVVSESLAAAGQELITGCGASGVFADRVVLDDGRELTARLVVDARGPAPTDPTAPTGFQKFLGLEVVLADGHGLEHPILMDARVDQTDGYRFFYVLPFAKDRLLVEETRFSSTPDLDESRARDAIERYCDRQGWKVTRTEREEIGVLEMPWSGETQLPGPGVLQAGYRGGWFHPGTGYSLPVAARLAEAVADHPPEEIRGGALRGLHRAHTRQREYCHLLNRLLFRWYPPAMRWHIFARFYRLPRAVIARFYALDLGAADQARLLVGQPPRGLSLKYRLESGAQ